MTNTTHSDEKYLQDPYPVIYILVAFVLVFISIWGRCWVQVLAGSGVLMLVVGLTAHRYITRQNKDDDKDDTRKNFAISSLAFLVIYIIYAGVFLYILFSPAFHWGPWSEFSEYRKECPRILLTKGLVSLWFLAIALALAASAPGL